VTSAIVQVASARRFITGCGPLRRWFGRSDLMRVARSSYRRNSNADRRSRRYGSRKLRSPVNRIAAARNSVDRRLPYRRSKPSRSTRRLSSPRERLLEGGGGASARRRAFAQASVAEYYPALDWRPITASSESTRRNPTERFRWEDNSGSPLGGGAHGGKLSRRTRLQQRRSEFDDCAAREAEVRTASWT